MRTNTKNMSLKRHLLGAHPLIRYYLQRMNFDGIIRGCLGSGLRHSLSHAEVLSVLIHNILVSRGPMYRIRQWAQKIEPECLGLTADQVSRLNDDRIVRSLEALAGIRGRSVFFRLALRVIKDFKLQTSRVHFDTTTVTFSGEYESSCSDPHITHGINKDHRPDLKQLLFGLNVTSDGAVPILHHVFSGNRTDDSVHVRNTNQLRELLSKEDFIYVADCKLCTKDNLAHIDAYGGKFVTVMPRTRKEDQAFRQHLRSGGRVRWRKFHEIRNDRNSEEPPAIYSGTDAGPKKTEEGYRIIWVRSSQKAQLDRDSRTERMKRAETELKLLIPKIGRKSLKTHTEVEKRVQKILNQYKVAAFLDYRFVSYTEFQYRRLRRGRPRPDDPIHKIQQTKFRVSIQRNSKSIRAEARTDGVFPLVTNLYQRSKRSVLEIYKFQPYLEKRFALTKSEYGVTPIFLKKPRRVIGLLHVYFVAIMLSALLERQVRLSMKKRRIKNIPLLPEGRPTATPTTPRILENFFDLDWNEVYHREQVLNFPVEVDKNQKLLLELADAPRSLYH